MQLDTPNYIILRINEVTTRPLAETTFPNRGLRAVKAANAHELAYRTTDNTVIYFPSEDKLTASGGSFIGVSAPSIAATNLNNALEEIYQAATGGAFPTPVIDGSFLFRNTDGSYGVADGAAVPAFRWDGSQYLVNGTLKANVFDLAGKYQIKSQAYGIQVDDTLGGDFRFKVGGTALDINAASNGVDNVTSRFVQDTTFNDTGLEITNGAVTTDFYDANGRSRLFAQELNQGEAYVEVGTQYTNGLNYVTVNGITVNVNSTDLNLTAGGVFTLRGSQGSRIYFNINGAQAPDANSAFIGAYSSGGFGQSALLLQSGQKNGGGAGAGIQLNHNQTLLYSESGNTSSGFVKVEGGRIEVFTGNSRGVYFQNNVNSRVDVRFVDPELTFYTPTKITGLDGNGFLGDATALVQSMINSSIVGTSKYKGGWNASTNTPTLPTGSDAQGDYYIVTTAGTTNLSGITEWSVGDWAIYNGVDYEKVDNTQTIPSNIGVGAQVFKGLDNVTNVAEFRTLVNGSIISFTQNANEITIDDASVVSTNTPQTITGAKTFSSDLTINDDLLATSNTSQIIGGFGANTTGGVKSWDHSTNARSGSGETLLFTDATNGSLPHSNDYYHPFSFEFNSRDGSGNLTQFAIPYRTQLGKLNYRSKFNGVWQEWAEFLISKPHATERVYNLPTSTNSNPTTGDFWFDGANIRVQGNLETSGDIEVNNSAGGDPFVRLKTAAQEWVMRIDQSNSERFEIRDVTNSVSPISIAPNGSVDVSSLSIDKKIVLQTFNNSTPTIGDFWSDGQEFRGYQRGNQANTAYDMNMIGASVSILSSQDISLCPFGFSQVANSTATDLPSGWATSGVSNVITYGHEPNSTTISQVISTGDRIAYRGSRTGTWNEITGGGGGATLLKATIPKADLDTSWSGNTYYTYTKTVTGAEVGDCVNVSFTDQLMAEIAAQNAGIESLQGTVSATDTVKVYVRVTSFITIPTGGDILITVAS